MFGFISKKKIIKVAVDTYLKNDTSNDMTMEEFRYRRGVANAIGYICHTALGIDITKEVRKAKEHREGTSDLFAPIEMGEDEDE